MVSQLQIYTFMIFAAFSFGITELVKSISVSKIPNSVFQFYFYVFAAILLCISSIFYDKEFTMKNITSLSSGELLLTLLSSAGIVFSNYFYLSAFKMNSELKQSINVGILSAILALYFIVTIFADVFLKMWKKERVHITMPQIIGCVLIVAGIIVISTQK